MKFRDCPFCKRPILMLAQSCEHCGGDLSSGELKGMDWRNKVAMETQLRLLKFMRVEIPADVGRGVAADLIQQVKEEQPQLFQDACERDRKAPMPLVTKLVIAAAITILIVAAIYGLRRFGVF
jgi:hypothetical protein